MKLRDNARSLRRNLTDTERALWRALRNRSLGCKYRRQHPVGPYIADFVCTDHRIVIEADGGQHSHSESDAKRDAWFNTKGYRVLRYWNNDVLSNLAGVLETIHQACSEATPADERARATLELTHA